MKKEIEVKIAIISADWPEILSRKGFHLLKERLLERNLIFDFQDFSLFKGDKLLRLREYDGKVILTYKDKAESNKIYKIRSEIELEVSCLRDCQQIFQQLGLTVFFEYEKYRTVFEKDGCLVMLDETPLGNFFELEAEPEVIDKTAGLLGFSRKDYLTQTYYELFSKKSGSRRMVFE